MIKHVVCFKLNDIEQIGILKQKLLNLVPVIPQIISMEVGENIVHTERSFDLALIIVFNSVDDLDIYAKHPEHVKVAEYNKKICKSIVSVDFEL